MAVRHPHPVRGGPGRVRTLAEGVLALAVLTVLVAALVGALAWAMVRGVLLLVE